MPDMVTINGEEYKAVLHYGKTKYKKNGYGVEKLKFGIVRQDGLDSYLDIPSNTHYMFYKGNEYHIVSWEQDAMGNRLLDITVKRDIHERYTLIPKD